MEGFIFHILFFSYVVEVHDIEKNITTLQNQVFWIVSIAYHWNCQNKPYKRDCILAKALKVFEECLKENKELKASMEPLGWHRKFESAMNLTKEDYTETEVHK